MSETGQIRPSDRNRAWSVHPLIADLRRHHRHDRFVSRRGIRRQRKELHSPTVRGLDTAGGAAINKLDNWSAERGRGTMRMLLVGMFCLLGVVAIIPVAVIAFSAPTPPPAVASMATISKQIKPDFPAPRQFQARDGASLHITPIPQDRTKSPFWCTAQLFPEPACVPSRSRCAPPA
jgi:hypothetical protein